eukprot:355955-Chlamydomonas_euryale.AAC.3
MSGGRPEWAHSGPGEERWSCGGGESGRPEWAHSGPGEERWSCGGGRADGQSGHIRGLGKRGGAVEGRESGRPGEVGGVCAEVEHRGCGVVGQGGEAAWPTWRADFHGRGCCECLPAWLHEA